MWNFRNKLSQFMYGRYGIDQLYYASIAVFILLVVVNSFLKLPIIYALQWLVLTIIIFRAYSRNIYKRSRENAKFLEIWRPIYAKLSLTVRRIREIKTHRFRKCPNCKKELRLPLKRGKHTVVCPCCHSEFKTRILL